MDIVEIIIGVVVFVFITFVAGIVLFKVARRTMKFMVRAVIFGVIVVALAVGAVLWWATRSDDAKGGGKPNRPVNSRRR